MEIKSLITYSIICVIAALAYVITTNLTSFLNDNIVATIFITAGLLFSIIVVTLAIDFE